MRGVNLLHSSLDGSQVRSILEPRAEDARQECSRMLERQRIDESFFPFGDGMTSDAIEIHRLIRQLVHG